MKDMNNNHLIEVILFIGATIGGLSLGAGVFPHCDDVNNFIYSKMYGLRILVAVIIGLMVFIGIFDLLGLSKKPKPTRQAKAFATGLGLGMTIFQVASIIMNSDCFRDSWLLPIPSG